MDNAASTPTWASQIRFSWYDYSLFASMLVLSTMIGIYFGFFGNKQSSASEYLMGSKVMKVFPVAMSLIASHVSGVSLLAVPADIYQFGVGYWMCVFSVIIICLITNYIYLPIFYNLQLTSTYEYLKLRFDSRLQILASFLYSLYVILFLPIVIYTPSLAFAQATGTNIYYIIPIICGVCIFYTTVGGLKAVVWSDAIQFGVTIGALITVVIVGVKDVGGLGQIVKAARAGERFEIDFDVDLTKRDTFWAVVIGWTMNWVSHVTVSQGCVQKFLSLPTLRDAKRSLFWFGVGIVIVKTTCVLMGLLIYARYQGCDPLMTGQVEKRDQLVPYYVMDVVGHISGVPGLFIAGVVCTGLSTLSANMNCLAGSIYKDFVARFLPKNISEKSISNILKLIVLLIGVVSTLLVLIVEQLGGILALSITFSSITGGTLLGVFTLGVLFPKANSTGTFYGAVLSLAFMAWFVFQVQWYKAKGILSFPSKPLSTEICDDVFSNMTTKISEIHLNSAGLFYMYKISFYYFSTIGGVICIGAGLLISWLTRKSDPPVASKELLCPWVHRFANSDTRESVYYSVQDAVKVLESTKENAYYSVQEAVKVLEDKK